MSRAFWQAFIIAIAACLVAGLALNVYEIWTHPVGIGWHLLVGVSAGLITLVVSGWLLGRRR